VEQKVKFVKIYVFRTNCVFAEVGTHQNAKAVFAQNRLVENVRLVPFRLLFFNGLFAKTIDI